jgi:hypothetical protein
LIDVLAAPTSGLTVCKSLGMVPGRSGPARHLGDDVAPGMRVKVVQDPDWSGPWRQDFLGTIVGPNVPFRVIDLAAMPEVNVPVSDLGPMREFDVRFDEPQQDCDGLGPYRGAVIWEKYFAAQTGQDSSLTSALIEHQQ